MKADTCGRLYPAMTMYQTRYVKRVCPDCLREIYDELECMYCHANLNNVSPVDVNVEVKQKVR